MTNHFILAGVGADTIDPEAKLSYTTELVLGVEREIMPRTTFGVRYVHRNMPRVLEDVANCPMAAYELRATSSVCSSVDYILTNPSSATPVNPEAVALVPAFAAVKFDDPVHNYDAVEITLNRRGSNWTAMASYRYSRLRGNFEGFYRDDNGQSDPGISSLYDFPTNDPTYTSIGGKAFGYPGDIRFLGDANGILPLDRPNQFKLNGNYVFVIEPERRREPEPRVGQAADADGGQPQLRKPRRNPGCRARHGHSDDRRVHDPLAV